MNKLMLSAVAVASVIAIPAQAKTAAPMQCAAVNQAQVESLFSDFNNAWASKNPDTVTSKV